MFLSTKTLTKCLLAKPNNQSLPFVYGLITSSPSSNNQLKFNNIRFYSSTSITNNNSNKNNNNNNNDDDENQKRLYDAKNNSPVYHQNSTLYSYTPREVLQRIEKEFKMPPVYQPITVSDKLACYSVKFLRKFSNLFFREKYIHYALLLETIAAIPGLVAGALIHLKVLRTMENNNWIKILLDESENERMHLLSFIQLTKPSLWERGLVAVVQGIYWNLFLACYLISPKTCHRATGYLEAEAVISYTNFLRDIDAGLVKNIKAPPIAIEYWGLPKDASLRDLILVIRQDEVDHHDVNHEISDKISLKNNDPILLHNHFIEHPTTTTKVEKSTKTNNQQSPNPAV